MAMERRLLGQRPPPETSVSAPATEVWELVRRLPRRQREVVVLRHVADLTEERVATVLGISRSTVSSTLVDAHRRLAELMQDDATEVSHG